MNSSSCCIIPCPLLKNVSVPDINAASDVDLCRLVHIKLHNVNIIFYSTFIARDWLNQKDSNDAESSSRKSLPAIPIKSKQVWLNQHSE